MEIVALTMVTAADGTVSFILVVQVVKGILKHAIDLQEFNLEIQKHLSILTLPNAQIKKKKNSCKTIFKTLTQY